MRPLLLPAAIAAIVGIVGIVAAQTYPSGGGSNAGGGTGGSSAERAAGRTGPVAFGGSGSYLVTSSSNGRSNALWIVDSVQQTVTLCEKLDTEKDFTCRLKQLNT